MFCLGVDGTVDLRSNHNLLNFWCSDTSKKNPSKENSKNNQDQLVVTAQPLKLCVEKHHFPWRLGLKLPKLMVVNDGGISQLNQNFKVQNVVKKYVKISCRDSFTNHDMFGSCQEKTKKGFSMEEGIPAGFFWLDPFFFQQRCRTWWKITRSLARRFGSLSLPARIKTTTCTLEKTSLRGTTGRRWRWFVHQTDPPKDKTCGMFVIFFFWGGGRCFTLLTMVNHYCLTTIWNDMLDFCSSIFL